MVLVRLLSAGVGRALDAYADRHSSSPKNDGGIRGGGGFQDENHNSFYETGIVSRDDDVKRREEDAFRELQNYADYQKVLSAKLLDEIKRENHSPEPYHAPRRFESRDPPPVVSNGRLGEQHSKPFGSLSCPIIIPQLDNHDESTFWGHSYTSDLMYCGVVQTTFFGFLDSLNDSLKLNPLIETVNIGALNSGIGWRSGPGSLSSIIPIAVAKTKDLQARDQSNSFLTYANDALFAPRGLFAMAITYQPNEPSDAVIIDAKRSQAFAGGRNLFQISHNSVDTQPASSMSFHEAAFTSPPRTNSKLRQMSSLIAEYGEKAAQSRAKSPMLQFYNHINQINERRTSNATYMPSHIPTANIRDNKRVSQKRRRRRSIISRSSPLPDDGMFDTRFGEQSSPFGVSWNGAVQGASMYNSTNEARPEPDREMQGIQQDILYLVIVNDPGVVHTAFDNQASSTHKSAPSFEKLKAENPSGFGELDRKMRLSYNSNNAMVDSDAPPEYDPTWQRSSDDGMNIGFSR